MISISIFLLFFFYYIIQEKQKSPKLTEVYFTGRIKIIRRWARNPPISVRGEGGVIPIRTHISCPWPTALGVVLPPPPPNTTFFIVDFTDSDDSVVVLTLTASREVAADRCTSRSANRLPRPNRTRCCRCRWTGSATRRPEASRQTGSNTNTNYPSSSNNRRRPT